MVSLKGVDVEENVLDVCLVSWKNDDVDKEARAVYSVL